MTASDFSVQGAVKHDENSSKASDDKPLLIPSNEGCMAKETSRREGWPTLTGILKGSGSQFSSIVLLIVRRRQHLSQAEQQLSQRWQQMPSHHIQLEVLHPQRNSGVTGPCTTSTVSG